MPHLDVPGARLYWESDGHASAPPLLLIHAGIANLRMWDPIVPDLARDHLVIRFDTRGFGSTEFDEVAYSERADALAVLEHLGVERATVIGASRGGSIALDLALEHPSRVTGIVAIGSGASGRPDEELTPHEAELVAAIEAAEADREWERVVELETAFWVIGPERTADDVDAGFLREARELGRSALRHAGRTAQPAPLDPPAAARLGEIAVPVLAMVGAFDISPLLVEQAVLVGGIPDATGAVIDDAAHLPSLERAAETLRVLRAWLDATGL